jgi:hypothetical protein
MYEVVKGLAESPKPPRKLKDWKNRLSLHLTNEKQLAQPLPADSLVREVGEAAQAAYNAVSGLKE